MRPEYLLTRKSPFSLPGLPALPNTISPVCLNIVQISNFAAFRVNEEIY